MSIVDVMNLNPKLVNQKTGVIREIMQWLPEYDDPRISVVAALMSDTSQLGISAPGSAVNSGAALNAKDAAFSAVGECIERFCSIPSGEENITISKAINLPDEFIPPHSFEFYSNSQYLLPDFPFTKFTEDSRIGWIKVIKTDSTKEEIFAPAATVFLPYMPRKELGEQLIWLPVSTGLSCGTTLDNAIKSGIYEVIERDAFMLSWLLGEKATKIDISDVSENDLAEMRAYGESLKHVTLLNITSDLSIPTVLGIFHKPKEGLLVAAACRSTFREAIKKHF